MFVGLDIIYIWHTVKYVEIYIHNDTSPQEARQALTDYFVYYTYQHPLQALGYQTLTAVHFKKTFAQKQNE